VAFVRKLLAGDVDRVVQRIARRLRDDSELQPFVNPEISLDLLGGALRAATSSTWVALDGERLVGHIYGALLENDTYGQGAWIGPDGVSYDSADILADLYSEAGQEWIKGGALEHYVWVLDDRSTTEPWYELGFARMHMRGVLALERDRSPALPQDYVVRHGTFDDLDLAVELVEELDRAQRAGPSFLLEPATAGQRGEIEETLSDPEVHLFIVEHRGRGIAQCMTFPLPPRRGSFEATLHLSAVVVRAEHQRRGIATAMVNTALSEARLEGFSFVETNWRVTNRRAARYWTSYGFQPTYVRLHRTVGAS
jgi:GNAT superfamily N-acetyltransferase